ncbi:hypothetical protein BU23DRAFT_571747 [Bimuria novae-zelandiae CBS 107.79]|uniref:Uncharacterized protein n=1 Tax=Bimuria novae-zelandiae CBS 107.79 TaxID=1447943 RepID=A0A6A5UWV8_9PLEO|nr:hypothetical protein BU23DRAFT_571747 [Bimuria novae-zelandiae CBS 107.79]
MRRPLSLTLVWICVQILNYMPDGVVSSSLAVRGQCCPGGEADDGDANCQGSPSDIADTVPVDKQAGIGFEFELASILFEPKEKETCTDEKTYAAKGRAITGRSGTNWKLTADTLSGKVLDAEYILDGTTIKLGSQSGDLRTVRRAAEEVAADISAWDPHVKITDEFFEIEGNECNPWKIIAPEEPGTAFGNRWASQATAPLPLEVIQDLFRKARSDRKSSSLLPQIGTPDGTVCVTKLFFQAASPPGGLDPDSLKDDFLGFLSLVLSYAKADKSGKDSIKEATSLMPRNDFSRMYQLLKDQRFDPKFRNGDERHPQPKDKALEDMIYERDGDKCTMKEWIDAIEARTVSDPITRVDRKVDDSVGRFDYKWEYVLNTNREVPLFEFRRLKAKPADFGTHVQRVEDEILAYHRNLPNAPRLLRKRQDAKYSHIRRDGPTDGCPAPTSTSTQPWSSSSLITPAPTMLDCVNLQEDPDVGRNERACVCGDNRDITLPILSFDNITVETQSCEYTAIPTTSFENPVSIETTTYTSNCYWCTLVGGNANIPTCATTPVSGCTPTTSAVPTATVWLSNNSIPIGEASDSNDGADLTTITVHENVINFLQQLLPSCAGPDHITSIFGQSTDPYANHMNIGLKFELHQGSPFNAFICELVVDGLTAIAMAAAPELAGAEVWQDIELQALCEGLMEGIEKRDANITNNAFLVDG